MYDKILTYFLDSYLNKSVFVGTRTKRIKNRIGKKRDS